MLEHGSNPCPLGRGGCQLDEIECLSELVMSLFADELSQKKRLTDRLVPQCSLQGMFALKLAKLGRPTDEMTSSTHLKF